MNYFPPFPAKFKIKWIPVLSLFLLLAPEGIAHIARQYLDISVSPSLENWEYQVGENVDFVVRVTQSGRPVPVEIVRFFVKG